MRYIQFITAALLAAPCALPQAPVQAEPPPEMARFEFNPGKWECRQDASTGTAAAQFTTECRWTARKFLMVCESSTSTGDGSWVYAWNAQSKKYLLNMTSSTGASYAYPGTVEGSKWTFSGDGSYQGKAARYEFSFVLEPPARLTYSWRRSIEGGPWIATSGGSCRKAQ